MYVEVKIDASSFNGSNDYTITFAGTTVNAADIPTFGQAAPAQDPGATEPTIPGDTTDPDQGGSEQPGGTTPSGGQSSSETSGDAAGGQGQAANKSGIAIDGNFNDWNSVQKVETNDPNPEHPQNLASEAMVFDGDYVYLYIEEGDGGAAWGAGTHSNGQFSIKTDLGNELIVQLLNDGTATAGGQKVDCQHVGKQWEIAVPKTMLPSYEKTLNFGLYLSDPTVKDVANLDETDKGNAGSFSGIVYDGDYSDWKDYPHTTIQYATAGTQEHVADAQGAMYADGDTLYTHVRTDMPEHLKEQGSEFLWSVTYDFDGHLLYPSYAEVDRNGNIKWYSGGETLSEGTHELYIFDTSGWHNSTNINNLSAGDTNYGKVIVTVGKDGKVDEMESEMDLHQVAKKLNCDASDFKTIKSQFGRLGQEWLECAGTSTNPVLGTGIALASVAVVLGGYTLYRRRNAAQLALATAPAGTANAATDPTSRREG